MQVALPEVLVLRENVLFLTPTLSFGGAERVLLTLIQGLDRSCYEISLVALSKTGSYLEEVPGWLCVHDLGRKGRFSFGKLILKTADILREERPRVAISFTGLANFVLLIAQRIARTPTRVIITEHINPSQMYNSPEEPLGFIKRNLIKWLYPFADVIVAVSEGVKQDLVQHFKLHPEKIRVIYDPVNLEQLSELAREEVKHPWFQDGPPIILSAGRLTPQKDYPTLLKAFARLREQFPVRLVILGDGPEELRLRHLALELGIADDAAFLGYQSNPYKYMAGATVFALSSQFEGFGLVLVEAMALGLPVVATRCPSGPDEILEDGACGLLVPVGDHQALARAMTTLIMKPEVANHLAAKGARRAADFSVQRIALEYEECLAGLLSKTPQHVGT